VTSLVFYSGTITSLNSVSAQHLHTNKTLYIKTELTRSLSGTSCWWHGCVSVCPTHWHWERTHYHLIVTSAVPRNTT